jgi:hypothetical protein
MTIENTPAVDSALIQNIAILGFMLSGIGTFGWQLYNYLRYNIWTSVSVIDALQWTGQKWAYTPTDWLGVYRILEWMPLSVALPTMGIVVLWARP